MNVVAIPIIESNTELQGTRHSSMTARNVGGTTDRNSLSTRQANGAAISLLIVASIKGLGPTGVKPWAGVGGGGSRAREPTQAAVQEAGGARQTTQHAQRTTKSGAAG